MAKFRRTRTSAAHCARMAKIRKRRQREAQKEKERDAKHCQQHLHPQNSSEIPEQDRASPKESSLRLDSEKRKQQFPTAVVQNQLLNPMNTDRERKREQVFNIHVIVRTTKL